jgi:dTDP-4-dehydrorhamnose reductase
VSLGPVLITGGGGQLASDLLEPLQDTSERVAAPARAELDITDADRVEEVFADLAPRVVLNCAAFHNVDQCEREEKTAWRVNVSAVGALARLCARHGAKLVHFGTNYVFDGRRPEPYSELDLPSPRSVYALTKLAGEYAALAYAPDALVVRGAGLYGLHGSVSKGGNFVQRMLARAADGGGLKVVDDQRLQPTFTADLAEAVSEALAADARGVLHLTAGGACSWYEFTVAIMETAGVEVEIEPTETVVPPGSPDRPLNGVLAHDRAAELGLSPLRHWRDGLDDYMRRAGLAAEAPARG